jgi:EAL domain-containing protein (putative c-di-GMP-specific phosphodiesterase class I)/PleD family two-component response regulator
MTNHLMESMPGRLLVVDDEEPNRDLLSRRLRKAGFAVECAASAKEALALIEKEPIDLVLLDNMMPEMTGMDLLRLLRATQTSAELPVIMVTALSDSSRIVEALASGANDYVTKPIDFPVALARVEALLERRKAELETRARIEREARGQQLLEDSASGLPTQTALLNRLNGPLPGYWMLVYSLDRLKMVQMHLGGAASGSMMKTIALRLKKWASDEAMTMELYRLDDDQIALLVGGGLGAAEMERVARRGIVLVEEPMEVEGRRLYTSANGGMAEMVETKPTAEVLFDALTALAEAKGEGRGRVLRFEEQLRGQAIARMEIENDVRLAIERNEFELYYQPKVELKTGRMVGFEALLRWKHPTKGMLPPDLFIPIAEQSGLIIPLGNWVLGQACTEMQRWRERYPELRDLSVSVNVSTLQVKDGDLVARVREALELSGLPPEHLNIEVTESAFLSKTNETTAIFDEIRAMGIELNLDDFGTGYSSLQYLNDLKFDKLKIDKSFLKNISHDEQSNELMRSMVQIAQNLGMMVVAEGVETQDQLDFLCGLGCEYGQGYLFSRPVPVSEVEKLLEQARAKAAQTSQS